MFSFLEHFVFCLLLAGWTPTLKPQSWILQIWKSGICGQDCLRNSENRWENLEFIQLPRDEILGFLVDSEAEALELRAEFASDDGLAGRCLVELWTRVLPRTQRLCQRRGRVDPALQSLVVSSAAAPSIESAEAQQTLSWLKLQSGACRQFRSWSARQRGQSECVQTQQSRADLEATELKRWRASLAELVIEADLPVSHHAQLTSNPEAIIAASLGSMCATTIRKRVREWRKVRNFSLQLCGHAWPTHVGVVLDYLHERMEEPCARTVPEAVLAALAFMEKAGSVAAADRLASMPVRNFVNQATQDLEVGAPPKKSAPLLPVILIGSWSCWSCAIASLCTRVLWLGTSC